jgi:post-segregation antitoxin (ccd killing protein)
MGSVISVRIPDELREELSKYGVEVSEVTRRALKEEVEKRKMEEAREAAKEIAKLLKDIPDEHLIKSIREDRDRR